MHGSAAVGKLQLFRFMQQALTVCHNNSRGCCGCPALADKWQRQQAQLPQLGLYPHKRPLVPETAGWGNPATTSSY